MKVYNLLILLAVLFVSDYAFSQTCPCDTLELSNGTTGNDIIELLCPGGELGEGNRLDLSPDLLAIGNESLGYLVENSIDAGHCLVTQDGGGDLELKITVQEAISCRRSVLERCDLNRNPIPTLSEWGMIAMAGVLGIIGLIVVATRRKAAANS